MESKYRVGSVLHKSHNSGNLILKSKIDVKIGDIVRDKKGKNVGKVFDVFGPVASPYISVKPRKGDPSGRVGEALYVQRKRK